MRQKQGKKDRTGIPCGNPGVINQCIQCGTCCRKGGPVLHSTDMKLIRNGHIGFKHLITVRKDEPVYSPLTGKSEPAPREILKVAGKNRSWTCRFLNEDKNICTIYSSRPLECRLLKCWDPSELISVMGKDTITRKDIIDSDNPIMYLIKKHDRECAYKIAEDMLSSLFQYGVKSEITERLTGLVRRDLALRTRAKTELNLPLSLELFYFGRPLFKILSAHGLSFFEADGEIHLHPVKS